MDPLTDDDVVGRNSHVPYIHHLLFSNSVCLVYTIDHTIQCSGELATRSIVLAAVAKA